MEHTQATVFPYTHHQHQHGLNNWQTTWIGCLCMCCSVCQSMIIRKLETNTLQLFAPLPSVQRKQYAHVSAGIWMTSSDIDFTPAILSLCGQKMYRLRFCLPRFLRVINKRPTFESTRGKMIPLSTNKPFNKKQQQKKTLAYNRQPWAPAVCSRPVCHT